MIGPNKAGYVYVTRPHLGEVRDTHVLLGLDHLAAVRRQRADDDLRQQGRRQQCGAAQRGQQEQEKAGEQAAAAAARRSWSGRRFGRRCKERR